MTADRAALQQGRAAATLASVLAAHRAREGPRAGLHQGRTGAAWPPPESSAALGAPGPWRPMGKLGGSYPAGRQPGLVEGERFLT